MSIINLVWIKGSYKINSMNALQSILINHFDDCWWDSEKIISTKKRTSLLIGHITNKRKGTTTRMSWKQITAIDESMKTIRKPTKPQWMQNRVKNLH